LLFIPDSAAALSYVHRRTCTAIHNSDVICSEVV